MRTIREITTGINRVLKELGEAADVDRAYLFEYWDNKRKMGMTYEWCRPDVADSHLARLSELDVSAFPWLCSFL